MNMKKILALLLCAVMLLPVFGCAGETGEITSGSGSGSDNAASGLAEAWVNEQIEANTLFSFEYDGQAFQEFIGGWDKSVDESTDEAGNKLVTLTYTQTEDKVVARADILLYKDFEAVDWVINFENQNSADSPIISNIQALDAPFAYTGAVPELRYPNGANATEDDFKLLSADLSGEPVTLGSNGGRSACGTMPFFDIVTEQGGLVGAIGWTGQWTSTFSVSDQKVQMTAGMSKTNISLYAGESMRTPSIALLFFEGSADDGHQTWRHLMFAEYSPRDEEGNLEYELPVFLNFWGSTPASTIMSALETVNRQGLLYDGVWIDAGWYGDESDISVDTYDMSWYNAAGSWDHIPSLYPDGMKPISDMLVPNGKEFLLWFEPERAMRETDWVEEHMDYMLYGPGAAFYLYDLSNDEAADYLIEYMDGKIKEYGMTWYRQDFNCEPYTRWINNDEENRKGMTEIKYITNLYRFLNTLRERNPGLMIDNCASGGRRIDIEMMKISAPLWRTDYPVNGQESNTEAIRSQNAYLNYWVPISATGSSTEGMDDSYEFRSVMANGMTIGWSWSNSNWINTMLEQYQRCRALMDGDYYMLANPEDYKTANSSIMYYKPETGEGYLLAFRPRQSDESTMTLALKGLDPDAEYTVENADTGEVVTGSGKILMENGLVLTMERARSSMLIFITKN